jgi:hypothetical protein
VVRGGAGCVGLSALSGKWAGVVVPRLTTFAEEYQPLQAWGTRQRALIWPDTELFLPSVYLAAELPVMFYD